MADQLADVLLHGLPIGQISIRGDASRFWLLDSYIEDPERAVLGLQFEEDLRKTWRASQRVSPWFSNLLPEGDLRELVARDQNVSTKREAQLLLRLGRDLPGAVEIRLTETELPSTRRRREGEVTKPSGIEPSPWRFSLAGVALKFSVVKSGNRFTLPANDLEDADWIIKLPDHKFAKVPENEYAMMSLARLVGIDVPDVALVHRDDLPTLPSHVWPENSDTAYAIRRFDRAANRQRVHIEDFAQVKNLYPEDRYRGSFESVAAICFRRRDTQSLIEFVRRMMFNALIGNGDAHLKNWSLIYRDGRIPALSPAYDLVSTHPYIPQEQMGLKFDGSRDFSDLSLAGFARLQSRLQVRDIDLQEIARSTAQRTLSNWREHCADLLKDSRLREKVSAWMEAQAARLL